MRLHDTRNQASVQPTAWHHRAPADRRCFSKFRCWWPSGTDKSVVLPQKWARSTNRPPRTESAADSAYPDTLTGAASCYHFDAGTLQLPHTILSWYL
jgi:hypothetical protein